MPLNEMKKWRSVGKYFLVVMVSFEVDYHLQSPTETRLNHEKPNCLFANFMTSQLLR